MGDEAEGYGVRVGSHGREVLLTCASKGERDAWLAALRQAGSLSAQRLYASELAKEKAEAARDDAHHERDEGSHLKLVGSGRR